MNVVTELDFIVASPNLHSALPYTLLPSRRMSFLAHMVFIVPMPMSIISFCTAASMHIFVPLMVCVMPSRAMVDSHNPGFIVGKSIAEALAAPRISAPASIEAEEENLM